jgi:hypothetical protein
MMFKREKCPDCGNKLRGDGERFECKSCEGGVFFLENGELVHAFSRSVSNDRECIACQQSLSGSIHTSEWEDGNNSAAFVTCKRCGAQNF